MIGLLILFYESFKRSRYINYDLKYLQYKKYDDYLHHKKYDDYLQHKKYDDNDYFHPSEFESLL